MTRASQAFYADIMQKENEMITDYAIDDFLEELASGAPVPGGGGASAVSGAMGAALGAMSLNLTSGKKKYQQINQNSYPGDQHAPGQHLRQSAGKGGACELQ